MSLNGKGVFGMAGYHNQDKIETESIVYDNERMCILLKEVSRRICEERKKRGLSMNRMGSISNLASNYIFKIESAQCDFSLKTFMKIATALGLEPDELLPVEKADKSRILTNGDQFDRITQDADVGTINYLLEQAKELVELHNRQK